MFKKLVQWFQRPHSSAVHLGRHRVTDALKVYTQLTYEYLSGQIKDIGQAINTAVLKSSVGGMSTTGTTQSGATPIVSLFNEFTTVGSSGGAAVLPAALAGVGPIYVDNEGAGNAMSVFAAGTDTINGGSAGGSISIAQTKHAIFYCVVNGNWKGLISSTF